MKQKPFDNIKVIIFDIDNTLLDFRKNARLAIKRSFDKWGLEFKEEYLPIFLKVNDKYWTLYEEGKITRDYLYNHRWVEIFEILGIDLPGALFEKDFVRELYNCFEKVTGAEEILEYLKENYKLVIATNSSLDEQSQRLRGAGLLNYFDKIYASEDIGFSKPDKNFYNAIFKDLKEMVAKKEILMIGDSINADINGSKNFGFKTAWFNPTNIKKNINTDLTFSSLFNLKEYL